ncbi:MAG: DUF3806 domain-containing protein [Halioglobus sp.]|nr:DUF3806 domain-containing protein [Halioglobus sp.]
MALLLCAGWVSVPGLAEEAVAISEPSKLDLQYMEQQRQLLQELAANNLGRQFSGDRERDLDLLQTLLDRQLVRGDQVRELQAMGVIMGDLLAADLGMHWVIYEDRQGRSRALRDHDSDNYLFPITMIARRREVGNETPVVEIYRKAYDIIDASRPPERFE